MQTSDRPRHDVQSVHKAIAILFTFSVDTPALGVAEIAQRVGLNRTTVHRLIGTLEAAGLIQRDRETGKYTLSARVLQLSNTFLQQSDVRAVAATPMTTLRDTTNETVALHLREGLARIVITQVGADRDIRHMYRNLGERIPLHLGAPGKVILAFQPEAEIASYLAQPQLAATTPFSITNPRLLREQLATIASQGYAVSWEERSLGVVSIAAPIFDATAAAIASINVSGPSQRIERADVERFVPLVVATAREISSALGYLGQADGHARDNHSLAID